MTRWCPRCDAVRDAEATCPACGTPLADLTRGRPGPPAPAGLSGPPPDQRPPPADPGTSRVRAALAVAVVVLAGLAFLAGRAGGLDQRTGGGPDRPAGVTTSSGAPARAATGRRELGWSARRGGTSVTAVAVERVGEEGGSQLDLRLEGLPRGQEVLGLGRLALRDGQGGLFASPDEVQLGDVPAVGVRGGRDGTYQAYLGPTPDLEALARVEVGELVVGRTSDASVTLPTPRPWPSGGKLRALDPGPKAGVRLAAGGGSPVRLDVVVTGAFVGDGRAEVVLVVQNASVGNPLPLTAQLRAGDRVLCAGTRVIGGSVPFPALVVGCRTAEVDRLTVVLGAGSSTVPLRATLHASG
jgi:hypothetical protein